MFLKGQCIVYEAVHDFLDTKKSCDYENLVTCIVIVHIVVIPRGRPRNLRDTYVRIKLQVHITLHHLSLSIVHVHLL